VARIDYERDATRTATSSERSWIAPRELARDAKRCSCLITERRDHTACRRRIDSQREGFSRACAADRRSEDSAPLVLCGRDPGHAESSGSRDCERTIASGPTTTRASGAGVRARAQCDAVLITRGEQGMWLSADGAEGAIPAVAREVSDVAGAGDTVVATLALALAAGATMTEAAVLANHAAGIVVGKFGPATVSRTNCSRNSECGVSNPLGASRRRRAFQDPDSQFHISERRIDVHDAESALVFHTARWIRPVHLS